MKSSSNSISNSLLRADWDSLANLLYSVENGIEGNDPQSIKLRARLGVVRIIIYENLKTWNGNNTIDASFLIASYKTIKKLEKEYDSRGIKNRQFLILLRLLLTKFEQQKLIAKKPLAAIAEFGKMKEVVGHGRDPL
ncbi:hypothetical protein GF318_00025 [Candidatus Micrarchaeota archaeon]|nr:hypothetical protein [Candidatus Micrarchaeota archaeon]